MFDMNIAAFCKVVVEVAEDFVINLPTQLVMKLHVAHLIDELDHLLK